MIPSTFYRFDNDFEQFYKKQLKIKNKCSVTTAAELMPVLTGLDQKLPTRTRKNATDQHQHVDLTKEGESEKAEPEPPSD